LGGGGGKNKKKSFFFPPRKLPRECFFLGRGGGGVKYTEMFFFSRQTFAVETLVRCVQSVWPLRFVSETQITFFGIFFVQTLQIIVSIRNRKR